MIPARSPREERKGHEEKTETPQKYQEVTMRQCDKAGCQGVHHEDTCGAEQTRSRLRLKVKNHVAEK